VTTRGRRLAAMDRYVLPATRRHLRVGCNGALPDRRLRRRAEIAGRPDRVCRPVRRSNGPTWRSRVNARVFGDRTRLVANSVLAAADATITFRGRAVATGVGLSWGASTVEFRGETY